CPPSRADDPGAVDRRRVPSTNRTSHTKGISMRRTSTAMAALGLGALVVAGLAGCSAPESSDGPLTVWVMGDSGANFEALVADYTAESGTDVEVVAIPWDAIDERLTT